MSHAEFVHLHLHTEYSLLDGANRVVDDKGNPGANTLPYHCAAYKMPALAITDHGNMYGAVSFYSACRQVGVKPIIGCEVYVAPGSRLNKSPVKISEASHHLTLLAKNEEGYRNLMRLVSFGFLDGFYYRPRVDKDLLAKYHEGLICLSGCLKGALAARLLANPEDLPAAQSLAEEYCAIFGKENYYIEIMDHGLADQKKVLPPLLEIARRMNLPLVATNDAHYLRPEDAASHEILLCIGTNKTINDPDRLRFGNNQFYFRSPAEMEKVFNFCPQSIKNTMLAAEQCNLEIGFDKFYMPDFPLPEQYNDRDEYLEILCQQGLILRYPLMRPEVRSRLDYELAMIKKMGFAGYFLIVWDFIHFAKQNGIPVGPGRGSGAGSLVAYVLGITDICPLKYGLLFERFLNPDRKSMPDLDIDFSDDGRERVIEYVTNKYGQQNVAQIVTFSGMEARGVIRDVGRALAIPLPEVDKLAKLIPFKESIYGALQSVPELAKLVKDNEQYKNLVTVAQKLEGLKRHTGVHAAGIVISKDEITNYTPLAKNNKGIITSQYDDENLLKLGLLKVDFLGLRTLSVTRDTVQLLEKHRGIKIELAKIPLDDQKTFDLLAEARTAGIFQLESSGMRDLLRKLKPTVLDDIVALISLYRPGPMGSGMLDDFVARKHKKVKVSFEHPLLEPVLAETYGVIVYQEQVMKIAQVLAGFTPGQADSVRKAMAKKIPEEIEKLKVGFLQGAHAKNIPAAKAGKVFEQIAHFGGYGFNKSHATAYGVLAYQTAYLKANYPQEYMAALLTSEMNDTAKVVEYTKECENMGIKVLPPDVQKSFLSFTLEGEALSFGLLAVKNIGQGAIESIIATREKDGRFKSLTDFTQRVDLRTVNKRVIESLILCGAFDNLPQAAGPLTSWRARLFEYSDKLLEKSSRYQASVVSNQGSFFDLWEEGTKLEEKLPELAEDKIWSEHKLLAGEKSVLGFYLSGHPLARWSEELKIYGAKPFNEFSPDKTNGQARCAGVITEIKQLTTKNKEPMARLKLEDLTGLAEVIVFPRAFAQSNGSLKVDEMVVINGQIQWEEERLKILADEIIPFARARQRLIKKISVSIKTVGLEENLLTDLKNLVAENAGNVELEFIVQTATAKKVSISTGFRVNLSDDFMNTLEKLFGQKNWQMR
ncbi:MAG: DNA polymerase III subunit alpha [Elusimicrobiota bacterium]